MKAATTLLILTLTTMNVYSQEIKIRQYSTIAILAAKINGSDNYACTIGNTIRISCSLKEFLGDTPWVHHEVNHTIQYRKYGTLKFACKYVYYWITKGYKRNPFELEADKL
jgi:hypothetical protein